jgi:hypothetical protein
MSEVFIFYSRKNKVFVKKLNESLDAVGVNTWVEREGIPPSADWMAEITSAIGWQRRPYRNLLWKINVKPK